MGQQNGYKCPQCGYEASVSGGLDFGFETVLVTISCRDCTELYDAVADERASDFCRAGKDGAYGEPSGIRCPKDAAHGFELWDGPGACPKCKATMVIEGLGLMWD